MKEYYISEKDIIDSINYFKELKISDDAMLPIYLITKSMGITLKKPVTFSGVTKDEKESILNLLWQLGGLQGPNEVGKKKAVLFPNAFQTLEFYQAGTDYNSLVGRIKDTLEKKNINVPLFNDNNKLLTLSRNYKDLLIDKYLHNEKISLKHFACWIFRFTNFEFPNSEFSTSEFTQVVNKSIRKLFKISKHDFLWIFEDDILNRSITPQDKIIRPTVIREQFNFDPDDLPEIIPQTGPVQSSIVPLNITQSFIELIGDNPSNEQIYNTLLQKKQIVLTGVPGIGKSRYLNALRDKFDDSLMIQFHANYSYEEFIGGETIKNSTVVSQKGQFLEFIEIAKQPQNTDKKYLFIIDELNRGNISQIFGETILTLDREYTAKLAKPIDGIIELSIPNNLYIACSMNTSDRNIAFIDLAIRRRFAFITLQPNYELLSSITEYQHYDLGNLLKKINTKILNILGKEELLLGHSYFILDDIYNTSQNKYIWTDEKFHLHFNFVVLPTLKEYTFSSANALTSIIGDELSTGLLDLNEFLEAFEEEFNN